jgi:gp16 family phage-associated protein
MKSVVDRNKALHALRLQKTTLKQWCEQQGYGYRNASNVLRGLSRAHFGMGKEIADKLNDLVRSQEQ